MEAEIQTNVPSLKAHQDQLAPQISISTADVQETIREAMFPQ